MSILKLLIILVFWRKRTNLRAFHVLKLEDGAKEKCML